jgi:uncharacterized protein YkwD
VKALVWMLMAWLAVPAVARADLRDVVNAARLQGCRSSARAPLRDNPRLDAAAGWLSSGQSLDAALTAAGYLAAQSSAVHLSGVTGDADVSRVLAAHYCATLVDPKLSEMGVQRRGGDFWMVLAAPVVVPAAADAAAVSRQILALLNLARATGRRCGSKSFAAAGPLVLNPALTAAALAHSQEMAKYSEFAHQGHDGSSPSTRVARASYGPVLMVGENIAAGAMTPAEVTQEWLESPAHCENIMEPRFTEIGIAYAVNLSSPALVYWTQDFALPAPVPAAQR